MIERVQWEELPVRLRTAVEERTGTVIAAEPVTQGLNCSVALTLDTRRSGALFFKGVRDTDTEGVAALRWEERVNSAVGGISPAVRHDFRVAGWSCLAFDYVRGSNADLSPGSPDLDAVTSTMRRMHRLRAPDFAIPPLADRFAEHLLPGETDALSGRHLLHTDTNPHNIMISDHGEAYVVDWAMPALGPAWVDPAYTAVRLMECEQAPAAALAWLNGFTSWRQADPKAVSVFVEGTCRQWTAAVGGRGAEASNARFRHLLGRPRA
ncbi:phosphotransferase [Streptomyces sp. NPDC058200]|uniref:phosphotransferase n=1 Tax=Streptomyces sp. NPDC058200 TaxID=3346378 RepID=UPI0036ED1C09